MRVLKILFSALFLLFVIVVIAAFFLFKNLNSIVKDKVLEVASNSLQTSVDLEAVDIKLLEGSVEFQGLRVGNPLDFQPGSILELTDFVFEIDPLSLLEPVYQIRNIELNGLKIYLQHKNLKDTNVQSMMDALKSNADPQQDLTVSSQNDEPTESIRLRIDNLSVGKSEVHLNSDQFGNHMFSIPSYVQSSIGDSGLGLTPEQLVRVVLLNLLERTRTAAEEKIKVLSKEKIEQRVKKKVDEKKQELDDKFQIEKDKLKEKLNTEALRSLFR